MALSVSDVAKVALTIKTKDRVEIGGRTHYIDRTNRYVTALLMRDHFAATVRYFDGLKFLADCGF